MHTIIEGFDYAIVTTVLGMVVVFLALTLLSLMMVALKAGFGERAGERSAPAAPGVGAVTGKGRPREAGGRAPAPKGNAAEAPNGELLAAPPTWVTAAVAAYLEREEAGGPTAEPWLPEFNHFDPWLGSARSMRRGR